MVGQLPPGPSGPAFNSSPAALQAPAEVASTAPADTQGQYMPVWRKIQTGVHSRFSKEGIAADEIEKWFLAYAFVPGA